MPEPAFLIFRNFDASSFWKNSEYALREYVGRPLTQAMIDHAESKLGYKLPASFLELLKTQNGGIPKNTCHGTQIPTSWAKDHVALHGIHGLDDEKPYSLCGRISSRFMIEEWGYPDIGIYFGDCPSAGHDMICLDYSKCGNSGEPHVVHVDQELDYVTTFVAENFEQFIRGLRPDDDFPL